MKYLKLTTIFLFCIYTEALCQKSVEVYISSNDCIKCTSGLTKVLNFCIEFEIDQLKIYTDYNSSKKRIRRYFPEIPDSLITCDREIIRKVIPDNKSVCLISNGIENVTKILLTEPEKLKLPNKTKGEIDPISIFHIKDSLFESGNFRVAIDGENIVVFQRVLQQYLVIKMEDDSISHFYPDTKTAKASYEATREFLETVKEIKLIGYDSAVILNDRIKLPISTISSFCIDSDTLLQFKTIYYYIKENGDNLSNRGFVFLEKAPLFKDNEVRPEKTLLIEPYLVEDNTFIGFYIFYNHQKLSKNTYLSYYTILNDGEDSKKLENQYFCCTYAVNGKEIKILKNYKFGSVALSDSLQVELRKYSHGNNPKYFSDDGEDYILYKNFANILNLNSGELISVNEFIRRKTKTRSEIDFQYIFDFVCDNNGLSMAFYDRENPGLQFATFYPNGEQIKSKINHVGNIDFLAVQSNQLILLRKIDEEASFEIKRYIIR